MKQKFVVTGDTYISEEAVVLDNDENLEGGLDNVESVEDQNQYTEEQKS